MNRRGFLGLLAALPAVALGVKAVQAHEHTRSAECFCDPRVEAVPGTVRGYSEEIEWGPAPVMFGELRGYWEPGSVTMTLKPMNDDVYYMLQPSPAAREAMKAYGIQVGED